MSERDKILDEVLTVLREECAKSDGQSVDGYREAIWDVENMKDGKP